MVHKQLFKLKKKSILFRGKIMSNDSIQFYMDESGNTGGNLLNIEQPFFVTGGWLTSTVYIKKISQYIDTLDFKSEIHYKKLPMSLAKESLGVMFKMVYDSINFFNNSKENDFVLPIFVRTRKDYLLIDRLIYSIFDSKYAPKEYKEYIDSLTLLFDTRRFEFIHVVKNSLGENQMFLQSSERLFNFVGNYDPIYDTYLNNCIEKLLNIPPYSENPLYTGFLKHLNKKEVLDDLNSTYDSRYQREGTPLVVSALFDSIENILDLGIISTMAVIYPDSDSNKGYIDDYWNILNKVFLNKRFDETVGYRNIKKIKSNCLSEDYLGIQLADVLCSMQNELLKDESGLSTKHLKNNSSKKSEKRQNDFREIVNFINMSDHGNVVRHIFLGIYFSFQLALANYLIMPLGPVEYAKACETKNHLLCGWALIRYTKTPPLVIKCRC